MFRDDVDAYGKPKAIMHKLDKIYDEFEANAILNDTSNAIIKELISQGWDFMLHYGHHELESKIIKGLSWEADFTRKMENGLWDNHECGYALSPNDAVNMAYNNIKTGKKLNRK